MEMSVARAERYIDELLAAPKEKTPRVNVGAFLKNVNQSLAKIQLSGIPAVSERRETDSQIVLTITIPKYAGKGPRPMRAWCSAYRYASKNRSAS